MATTGVWDKKGPESLISASSEFCQPLVTVKFGNSLFSLSFWILSKLTSFSLVGFVGHSHTATPEIERHPFPETQVYCG